MDNVVPTITVSGNLETDEIYLSPGIQPPTEAERLIDQIKIHSELQSYASGGAVLHLFLIENINVENKIKMIKNIFNNYPIRYITFTSTLSICHDCNNRSIGKMNKCNECGSIDISIWSRPVGYFRPVMRKNISDNFDNADSTFWHPSKVEEFKNRYQVGNRNFSEFNKILC